MKSLLKKTALIGAFYYMLILVNACCHCEMAKERFYNREGMRSQHMEYEINGDTTYNYTVYNLDSIFENRKYGLQIKFNTKETVQAKTTNACFINMAYACKCAQDFYIARDTLKNIRIITLRPFDASHNSGADVSGYFKYLEVKYFPTKLSKISIAERIAQSVNSTHTPNDEFNFYLDKTPDASSIFMQFELIAEFTNGKILKDTTTIITLK